MGRAYDTRPNLEGYDALTVRSLAKFVLVAAILIGVQVAADRFGFNRWLRIGVQLGWIVLGLRALWPAIKALKSGEPMPDDQSGPRYADREVRFTSPRTDAAIVFLGGAALILMGADGLFQILSE
jgi:hypothetical protein